MKNKSMRQPVSLAAFPTLRHPGVLCRCACAAPPATDQQPPAPARVEAPALGIKPGYSYNVHVTQESVFQKPHQAEREGNVLTVER